LKEGGNVYAALADGDIFEQRGIGRRGMIHTKE